MDIAKLMEIENDIECNITEVEWDIDDALEEIGEGNTFGGEFNTFVEVWNNFTKQWVSYRDSERENKIPETTITSVNDSLTKLQNLTDYKSVVDIVQRYSNILDDLTLYNNI